MKTPPIIAIAIYGAARLAFAQDAQEAREAGGHEVAVFTGVPTVNRSAQWPTPPRRGYGQLGVRADHGGIEGFTLGRQYNLEYLSAADVGDPFHTGTAGGA